METANSIGILVIIKASYVEEWLGVIHKFIKRNRCIGVTGCCASYVEVCVCVTRYFVYPKRCIGG